MVLWHGSIPCHRAIFFYNPLIRFYAFNPFVILESQSSASNLRAVLFLYAWIHFSGALLGSNEGRLVFTLYELLLGSRYYISGCESR